MLDRVEHPEENASPEGDRVMLYILAATLAAMVGWSFIFLADGGSNEEYSRANIEEMKAALARGGAQCGEIKDASPSSYTSDTVTVLVTCDGDQSYNLRLWYNGAFQVVDANKTE